MKVFESLTNVVGGVFNRGLSGLGTFPMRFQASEDFSGLAQHQSGLLLFQPALSFLRSGDFKGGRRQILAHVVKVDQVFPLEAEVVPELLDDPRRTIADAVHKRFFLEPTALSGLLP